jgi:ribose transport system ATP-binding protein
MNSESVAPAFKLEVRDVRKEYSHTTALAGVSLGFRGGEVHALLGKNGAGKSTLVKIMAGAVQPSAGQLLMDGAAVQLTSPHAALEHGIATVYQELSLVPGLTIAENILFGRLPRQGPLIDWKRTRELAREVLARMQLSLDVRRKVSSLSVAQAQLVEIAKAMSFSPKVLLLDEPTSALSHQETQSLFGLIRHLAAQNVAIIYVSHRLQELREIAQVMSVLRDGLLIGTTSTQGTTPASIAEMVFGTSIAKVGTTQTPTSEIGEPVLEVRQLNQRDKLHDISFSLARGEVLGIAGLLGSGRSELLMALFGATPLDSGEIILAGAPVHRPSPEKMKRGGLALSPEDRRHQGLVQMLSVRDNIVMAALDRIAPRGLMRDTLQRTMTQRTITELQIAVGNALLPVSSLSGGNQQKVVVGKWLNTQPRVLLLDEPTRGIDVQAKAQMFELILRLRDQGISSIFVSSELEELFDVCGRILIMREGRIVGEAAPSEISLEQLLERCMETEEKSAIH